LHNYKIIKKPEEITSLAELVLLLWYNGSNSTLKSKTV